MQVARAGRVQGKKDWAFFFGLSLLFFYAMYLVLPSLFAFAYFVTRVVVMGSGVCFIVFLFLETQLGEIHEQTLALMKNKLPHVLSLDLTGVLPPRDTKEDRENFMGELIKSVARFPMYPLIFLVIAANTIIYCFIFIICILRYGTVVLAVFAFVYLSMPTVLWNEVSFYLGLGLEMVGICFLGYLLYVLIETHEKVHAKGLTLKAHQLRLNAPTSDRLRLSVERITSKERVEIQDKVKERRKEKEKRVKEETALLEEEKKKESEKRNQHRRTITPKSGHREGGSPKELQAYELRLESPRLRLDTTPRDTNTDATSATTTTTTTTTPTPTATIPPLILSPRENKILQDQPKEHSSSSGRLVAHRKTVSKGDTRTVEQQQHLTPAGITEEGPEVLDQDTDEGSDSGHEGDKEAGEEKPLSARKQIKQRLKKFKQTYLSKEDKEKETPKVVETKTMQEEPSTGEITSLRVFGAERRKAKRKWIGTVEYTAYQIWVESDHKAQSLVERSYEEFQIFDKALHNSEIEKGKELPTLPVKDRPKFWRKLDPLDNLKIRLDLESYLQQVWTVCGGNCFLLLPEQQFGRRFDDV